MMQKSRILVMTGGSSGFGRCMVELLIAERPDWEVILLARRSPRIDALESRISDERLTVIETDLANLSATDQAARAVIARLHGRSIDAVALNAGVQVVDGDAVSADGLELTFAVNHLAHFHLADRLAPHIRPGGRLIFTSSEVHDPAAFCLLGIARAVWQEPQLLADGLRSQIQQPAGVERGEARYSASKLLNLLSARHFARTLRSISSLAFNPSVVPGTDIARQRNILQIVGWKYLLPLFAPILPGARTMSRSAGDLMWLITDADAKSMNGEYVNGRTPEPGSAESRDETKIAAVAKVSRSLIAERLAGQPILRAASSVR